MNIEWVRSVALQPHPPNLLITLFLGDCIGPKVISVGKNVLNLTASIDEFGILLRGLNVTLDEVCKANLEDGSSNIINYINSAPSPRSHVGVYWRGGALLQTITNPGFYLKLPLVTYFELVQVTLQTDKVRDIPCGKKGCVMINFEKIEIVDKLDDETMPIELRPLDFKEAL